MIVAGDLTLSLSTHYLSLEGSPKQALLTPKYAMVMGLLMKHTNTFLTVDDIQHRCFGSGSYNSVYVAMYNIRSALRAIGITDRLKYVYRDGWMLISDAGIQHQIKLSVRQMSTLKSILATAAPMHAERVKLVREALTA